MAASFFSGYLPKDGGKKLNEYEYKGNDASLYYKFVLAPLANYCVTFVPHWMAPNLITFSGFLLIVLSHIIVHYYCPTLKEENGEEAPRWIWLFTGIALFIYQNLDNMDGRQARRTGSSSPLGLLFDHGCDAWNVHISSLSLSAALNLGATHWSYAGYFVGSSTFYFNTWEEYYTGELNLAVVNGPSDGLLWVQISYIITFLYGPTFWDQMYYGFRISEIFLYGVAVLTALTIIKHIFTVISHSEYKRMKEDGLIVALTRLIPYVFIQGFFVLWVHSSHLGIFEKYPRVCIWTLAGLNIKFVMHLMLDHMTDEYHLPWRRTIFPFLFFGVYGALAGPAKMDEEILLKMLCVVSLVSAVHTAISLCLEIANALNIHVFTIDVEKAKKMIAQKRS